jgi:hypothetical protein
MNKHVFTIFLFTALTAGAQRKPASEFILNGKLKGQDNGLMYLYYSNNNNERVKDSAAISNGQFSFRGKINEPTM